MRSWVHFATRAALFLSVVVVLACQKPRAQPLSDRFESVSSEAREDVLAVRLREVTVEFAARVEEAADDIMDATDDEAMKRKALLWKMNAIPASRLAFMRVEAVVGLIDGWILCTQMRVYFETGPGRDMFGEHQEAVVATARRLEDRVIQVAGSIAKDETILATWQERVAAWAAEDPLDDLHFETHSSWVNDYADIISDELSVVDSIISLEELAFDVSQRVNIYIADMPRHARWQFTYALNEFMDSPRMQALLANMASIEKLAALEDLDGISDSLQDVGTRLDRLGAAVEEVPEIVAHERAQAIGALETEIAAALEVVREERQAVQTAIESERAMALEEIDRQRSETIETLSVLFAEQRTILIEELDRMTDDSMAAAEDRLERVVDHAFIRLVELLAALAVIAGVVLLIRRSMARAG